eukprot:CAMPEP_0175120068 /NCGR_PEP_ID=MMETSP0087-20121206/416_1 /TAXON_ID=136419 /ORGANISM="Unknown Unknown, Strain D1" /LENGTH=712 /DNA_ID=CAMNT_0016401475 /DNA_START=48 /DNA_END=2185 /DNA_ORIENTATION=+
MRKSPGSNQESLYDQWASSRKHFIHRHPVVAEYLQQHEDFLEIIQNTHVDLTFLDQKNKLGSSALRDASMYGHCYVVNYLLSVGADPRSICNTLVLYKDVELDGHEWTRVDDQYFGASKVKIAFQFDVYSEQQQNDFAEQQAIGRSLRSLVLTMIKEQKDVKPFLIPGFLKAAVTSKHQSAEDPMVDHLEGDTRPSTASQRSSRSGISPSVVGYTQWRVSVSFLVSRAHHVKFISMQEFRKQFAFNAKRFLHREGRQHLNFISSSLTTSFKTKQFALTGFAVRKGITLPKIVNAVKKGIHDFERTKDTLSRIYHILSTSLVDGQIQGASKEFYELLSQMNEKKMYTAAALRWRSAVTLNDKAHHFAKEHEFVAAIELYALAWQHTCSSKILRQELEVRKQIFSNVNSTFKALAALDLERKQYTAEVMARLGEKLCHTGFLTLERVLGKNLSESAAILSSECVLAEKAFYSAWRYCNSLLPFFYEAWQISGKMRKMTSHGKSSMLFSIDYNRRLDFHLENDLQYYQQNPLAAEADQEEIHLNPTVKHALLKWVQRHRAKCITRVKDEVRHAFLKEKDQNFSLLRDKIDSIFCLDPKEIALRTTRARSASLGTKSLRNTFQDGQLENKYLDDSSSIVVTDEEESADEKRRRRRPQWEQKEVSTVAQMVKASDSSESEEPGNLEVSEDELTKLRLGKIRKERTKAFRGDDFCWCS